MDLLTAVINQPRPQGEDDRGLGELLPDHVGIDPECDRWIGVPQPDRNHMDRHAWPEPHLVTRKRKPVQAADATLMLMGTKARDRR